MAVEHVNLFFFFFFLELRLYQNMDSHKNDVHVSMVNKRSKRGSVRGDGRMEYRRCRMVCIWP